MAPVMKIVRSWLATMLLFMAVTGYWVSTFWPPVDRWYELHSLWVDDARVHEPVTMHVDRAIHRPFFGKFGVVVRQNTPKGWLVVCNGFGGGDYLPNSVLPSPVTLDWWSNRACPTISEPGEYVVTTTISVVTPFGFRRVLKNESNVFVVSDATSQMNGE